MKPGEAASGACMCACSSFVQKYPHEALPWLGLLIRVVSSVSSVSQTLEEQSGRRSLGAIGHCVLHCMSG